MDKKVRVVKWAPPKESMTLTIHYAVPDPARLAEIVVMKLQRELLGAGCGCHAPAELIGLLKDLGVQIEITKVPEERNGNAKAN